MRKNCLTRKDRHSRESDTVIPAKAGTSTHKQNTSFSHRHSRESGNLQQQTPVFIGEILPTRQQIAIAQINNTSEHTCMDKQPSIYIMTNKYHGTLCIGVTSNLAKRVWQHRNHLVRGFTKKYGLIHLVYFELHEDMIESISREKAMKKWYRSWKIELIERVNPDWNDLYDDGDVF